MSKSKIIKSRIKISCCHNRIHQYNKGTIAWINIETKMTVDNNKVILQNTLGILLGFDDGAEDVLDHLLTIESGDVSLVGQGVVNRDFLLYRC